MSEQETNLSANHDGSHTEHHTKRHHKIHKNKVFWSGLSIGVILVVLIAVIVFSAKDFSTRELALEKVDYLLEQTGEKSDLISLKVGNKISLQEVNVLDASTLNNATPTELGKIYISRDGSKLVYGQIIDYTQALPEPVAVVEKSERPKVELFIWSYCPYGIQMQGPFTEVAALFRDYADFSLVPFHDGHGAYENQQNKIELCMQEVAPDKVWSYSKKVVDEVYPACADVKTEECDKNASVKAMTALGIDSDKVLECVTTKGDELFSNARALSSQYGISGSPTVVINGVKAEVGRSAEAVKNAVCDAMVNPPEICNEKLGDASAELQGNC